MTSSALSSAMGLTGLLVLAPTLPVLPALSSGCKNSIKAFSCDGLDSSIACLMYLRRAQRFAGEERARARVNSRVKPLPSLLQEVWVEPATIGVTRVKDQQ